MGIATAGTGLASGNIGLKLAPQEHSVAYLSMLSFTNSLSSGVAPILSGWLAGILVTASWSWTINVADFGLIHIVSWQHWDFLFLLSSATGGYALYRLFVLQEEGSISYRAVVLRWIANVRWGKGSFASEATTMSDLSVGPPKSKATPTHERVRID